MQPELIPMRTNYHHQISHSYWGSNGATQAQKSYSCSSTNGSVVQGNGRRATCIRGLWKDLQPVHTGPGFGSPRPKLRTNTRANQLLMLSPRRNLKTLRQGKLRQRSILIAPTTRPDWAWRHFLADLVQTFCLARLHNVSMTMKTKLGIHRHIVIYCQASAFTNMGQQILIKNKKTLDPLGPRIFFLRR